MAVPGRPSKIGKYEVVEVLGEGGMGAVYKAIDPRIGRTVAIKVIKGDFAEDPELRRRFDTEAKAVGNLQHPNIVVVYDFGEDNGSPYLVMQYLDGTPLDKIIAQRQNLPIIQKLEIVIEVLNALDYAHKHNVVHRDVKPANVQLLKDNHIKLLDFGIAREGNLGQTKTGQLMGTMWYMSPEQLNGVPVDGRSDVYSTGIMLFELLTYSLPFEARDSTALIVQRLRGDPPPPLSKYFENYPTELDDIIARSMMLERDERYNTAEDFAFDLARVQERLRRDMVSHFVDQARASIARSDLAKAKDLLSQVLKIDTQNPTAKQLFYEVQQSLQKVQRSDRVQQLRLQAEDAIAAKQLDQAANLVEQAIKVDKTDPDLLELREQVQEAKLRAQQVKKLLNLANVAQQSEEYNVAQKAVADALAIDPDDTDAKVMQASIRRLLVDHEKQNRIQPLLQVARREISARQFEAARENIAKAKAIDPAHPEIPGLEKMVSTGQEQEKRRIELQQVCAEIERRLVDNNLAAARDLAASALRKFPGEEKLIRLKTAADEAYEQQERRSTIEQHLASASRLVEDGQASNALKLLQDAERAFPADTRLREYLQVVRDAAAREAAEHEKKGILLRARSALRRRSFSEATDTLERGLLQFPADSEIRELLETARQESERSSQKKQVEDVSRQAQDLLDSQAHTDAIGLLERTAAQVSDPDLLRLLEYARQEAANYRAGVQRASDQANQMLDSGRNTDALRFLETQAAAYGRNAEFQTLLEHTRRHVEEVQQANRKILREVEEARTLIRSGDLYGAEAILRACQAQAPSEPEVLALAIKIEEEKKALEPKRQDEAQRARELQQRAAEAASTGASSRDASTRLFREGVKPEASSSSPGADFNVGTPPTTNIGSAPQGPSATSWFPAATAQPIEQPPTLHRAAPAEADTSAAAQKTKSATTKEKKQKEKAPEAVAPPPPPVVRFPQPAETEAEREIAPGPEPGKSKKLIVVAVAAAVVIIALITGIIVVSRRAPARPEPVAEKPQPQPTVETPPPVVSNPVTTPQPPPAAQGTLVVSGNVEGAQVLVDGRLEGIVGRDKSLKVQLDAAPHRVQIKKQGYEDSPEKPIEIAANKVNKFPFKLVEKAGPKPPPAAETYLTINTIRGAKVRIDSTTETVGSSGSLIKKVEPGRHSVEVNLDGYNSFSNNNVYVNAGENLPVSAPLSAKVVQPVTPPPPVAPPPKPAPAIVTFEAEPSTIEEGKQAMLRWETQNATEVEITGVGTGLGKNGRIAVTPKDKTTYKLTAKGDGGTTDREVTIAVNAPPKPVVERPPERPAGNSAAAISDADIQAIRDALSSYTRAFGLRDADSMKRVWPSMPKEVYANFKNTLGQASAATMEEQCSPSDRPTSSTPDSADWSCKETRFIRANGEQRPVPPVVYKYRFKKVAEGKWLIDGRS